MQDNNPLERFRSFEPGGPPGPEPRSGLWLELMDVALTEARLAGNAGDVPVGAVLASMAGRVIAKAGNRIERDHNPVAHAEILVLAAGGRKLSSTRLSGCILVVTLEPCLMCVGAIALARLEGVIFGAADARAGALISAADARELPLWEREFWHLGGVKSQESADLLKAFFEGRRLTRKH